MTETNKHSEKRIELKYPIPSELADQVRAWARQHLDRDPHGTDAQGDSYEVHTVYFDTPNLDLYHRTAAVGRTKYRVRRYGDESSLWLESKSKKRSVVRKMRTLVDRQELASRVGSFTLVGDSVPEEWCGDWFMQRTQAIGMRPTIDLTYQRFARTAIREGRPLRLTIDRELRAVTEASWEPCAVDAVTCPPLVTAEVLELKFDDFMPHLFKELLREFPIVSRGFSKYRTAMRGLTDDGLQNASSLSRCG